MDSKTSNTVKKLIYAALNEVAICEDIKIMLGVPYKLFRKTVLNDVIAEYKGKSFDIYDKIKGTHKKVNILDISIFREGDAALMWSIRNGRTKNKPLGMICVGFRTTELSYYDEGFRFNDKRSKTIEQGNRNALEYVQTMLLDKNISKDLNEIDSCSDYDDLKKRAYDVLAERVAQDVEDSWINLDEMEVYVSGGTALNMTFDERFTVVNDAQLVTARGLFFMGDKTF